MPRCLIIASTLLLLRNPSFDIAPHTLAWASAASPSRSFSTRSHSPGKEPSASRFPLAPSDVHRHPLSMSGAGPLGSEEETRYSTAAAAALACCVSSCSTTASSMSCGAPPPGMMGSVRWLDVVRALIHATLGSISPCMGTSSMLCRRKGALRFCDCSRCSPSFCSSSAACSSRNRRRRPISGALMVRPKAEEWLSGEEEAPHVVVASSVSRSRFCTCSYSSDDLLPFRSALVNPSSITA
mmetsp:Transcript_40789/g.96851  ORF Transcript_40789/g.96851 Transcript_40789/m.96851 type:complete len:240 (-) Transcript_40789:155-874(-)